MLGQSRYRLITTTAGPAWDQSRACGRDSPGAATTHLAVLETAGELTVVQALIDESDDVPNGVWIGGVQQHTATAPGSGWLGFDGRPLLAGAWYDGLGDNGDPDHEPNDGNGDGKENGLEQFVAIKPKKHGLQDAQGSGSKGALCECDGKAITEAVAAEIDRNHGP